jgi:hypothetical protein
MVKGVPSISDESSTRSTTLTSLSLLLLPRLAFLRPLASQSLSLLSLQLGRFWPVRSPSPARPRPRALLLLLLLPLLLEVLAETPALLPS